MFNLKKKIKKMEIFYFREVRKEFMRLISNLPMDHLPQIGHGTGSSNLLSAFHTIISVSYRTLVKYFYFALVPNDACPKLHIKQNYDPIKIKF
ncbi:hypothetical protein BpHYR1_019744 [Brachionus plicatilis]|uniref:Uncharacterized protein n=1 Tax=Brachionus plicatilis TaxID=10195 RepID=A0A3M7RB00_BRAPC|nr:hypothetical protein BpHYR1_019744 [Brachionus plicatilis]